MRSRDQRTFIQEFQNVEVKLPLHQKALRNQLLTAHPELTSWRRRLLSKVRLTGSAGRLSPGFPRLVPVVGIVAVLAGLVIVGVLLLLSGHSAPGQKFIARANPGAGTVHSMHTVNRKNNGVVTTTATGADVPAQASSPAGQEVVVTANDTSGSGIQAQIGSSDTSVITPPAQPIAQPPFSPLGLQVAAQHASPAALVAAAPVLGTSVSEVTDSVLPGNSGNAMHGKPNKPEKALTKILELAGL